MKHLITLLVLLLFGVATWADTITMEQAKSIAVSFLSSHNRPTTIAEPIAGAKSPSFSEGSAPSYYVFNAGEDEGFVIVSAQSTDNPVLGYTLQGTFCMDSLPPALKTMLDQYAEHSVKPGDAANHIVGATHPVISPMITSTWGQNDPYNAECPMFFTGNRCVTGCVATAMGQILRYHALNSYQCIQAQIDAYQCITDWEDYGHLSVAGVAARTPIEWGEMPDNFNGSVSSFQKKAVAKFLRYCGASVRMDYGDHDHGGSGAFITSVPVALVNNFGYKNTARVISCSDHTPKGWDELIYGELAVGRPIIMSARDTENNGHAFICDGYDGENRYHINWGWSGLDDGYFLLSALSPASHADGYNTNVRALIGIAPPMPSDVNDDEQINGADVVSVYNYIQDGIASGIRKYKVDVNQDNLVNGADVVSIYNSIIGGFTSKSEQVFDAVEATGDIYFSSPYYRNKVTIKNNLSSTISLHSIDVITDGYFIKQHLIDITLAPGQSYSSRVILGTSLDEHVYTTRLNFFYNGETYEKVVDTSMQDTE